jgi:hypothetical protein
VLERGEPFGKVPRLAGLADGTKVKRVPGTGWGNLRVLRALTCFGAQQIPRATGGLMEPNKKVVKEKGRLKVTV